MVNVIRVWKHNPRDTKTYIKYIYSCICYMLYATFVCAMFHEFMVILSYIVSNKNRYILIDKMVFRWLFGWQTYIGILIKQIIKNQRREKEKKKLSRTNGVDVELN